ncbi:hypothetical protein [Sporomusa malonica]|nr:hypothetical protein [Sporomusa malonica]
MTGTWFFVEGIAGTVRKGGGISEGPCGCAAKVIRPDNLVT